MPAYEYKCPLCGNESERIHPMNNTEPITCGVLLDDQFCTGIVQKQYKTPPCLSPQSVPTRRRYNYMKKR